MTITVSTLILAAIVLAATAFFIGVLVGAWLRLQVITEDVEKLGGFANGGTVYRCSATKRLDAIGPGD